MTGNGTSYSGLLDHFGNPLPKLAAGGNDYARGRMALEQDYAAGNRINPESTAALPHVLTFASIMQSANRVYSWRWDEALRNSREDALGMRRDAFIMAILQERKLATAQFNWHLEPEDETDESQNQAADDISKLIRRTPYLTKLFYSLLDAVWYGRFGVQVVWAWRDVAGKKTLLPVRWVPVNGDKIQYRFRMAKDGPWIEDGTPVVLVHSSEADQLYKARTVLTDRARGLLLADPYWRERFIIHQHELDDADFFEGEMAGTVHGVGVRSRIYWLDWLRKEWLSNVSDYIERVGQGMLIFYYEQSNPQSRTDAIEAANKQSDKTVIVWPRPIGNEKQGAGVEFLSVPTSGSEILLKLQEHLESIIERYIIGQSASSKSDASGMGTHDNSLQADTKYRLVRFDALNLQDTLTVDFVRVLKKWNLPPDHPAQHAELYFRFDIDKPDPDKLLGGAQKLTSMGVTLKADELRGIAGLSKPEEGDEVVGGQQQGAPGAPGAPGGPPPGLMPPGAQPGGLAPPMGQSGQASGGPPPVDPLETLFASKAGEPVRYDASQWTAGTSSTGSLTATNTQTGDVVYGEEARKRLQGGREPQQQELPGMGGTKQPEQPGTKQPQQQDLPGMEGAAGTLPPPQNAKQNKQLSANIEKAPPPEGEEITPSESCCEYDVNPEADDNGDGIADFSRVGVPAWSVPPPPKVIPRMPNLTGPEREAETRFANAFLDHPEEMIAEYDRGRNNVVGHDKDGKPIYEIGDAPNIFNTDDCKLLSPDYNPQGGSLEDNLSAKGVFNLAVHQTANALAKRAFLKYLDDQVSKLPPERRFVLVTSGGVAAGKGYALQNVPDTKSLSDQAGAIWDAAGEQNATENPWVLEECEKRGLKAIFAFIHADPKETWENPKRGVVERAGKKGRMVDARLFADSYTIGAKNFKAFSDKHKGNQNAQFLFFDNRGDPKLVNDVPEDALNASSDELYENASRVLQERAATLKPSVLRGGTIGQRVWGKPGSGNVTQQQAAAATGQPAAAPAAAAPTGGAAAGGQR